jgi:glycosyltransferase EpsE
MPKVSIIFPFYNCEKFIEEALLALKYLKSDKFEIIAINDGSTDKSFAIAESLLVDFSIDVTLLNRTTNQGCFKARTEAIGASRGEYIAIVDADDVSYRGRLEKQLKLLETKRDVWCCGGFADKIDHNSDFVGDMSYPPPDNKSIIKKIISDSTSNPIIDPTTMFRKSVFYELGGYSFKDDRNLVADMDLWFRALISDREFVNIQEPLIEYRVNPKGNTVSHKRDMIRQHVIVRNEFIKGFKSVCLE